MRTVVPWLDSPNGLAWSCGVLCFLVLALTAPAIAIVWDEGEYLARSDRAFDWIRLAWDTGVRGRSHAFSAAVIGEYWQFIDYREGHPSWGAIPIGLATALLGHVLHPLTAARMGSIALFSAACGTVAFRLRVRYGTPAAVVATASLVTLPRMFTEAHLATLDPQLTAWWLLLWAVDASGRPDLRAAAVAGVLGGLTTATKFPGVLAWPAFVSSRLLFGDARRRLGVLVAIPVGVVIFVLVNPPAWHDPVAAMITYVRLNVHRTLIVPASFFGAIYDLSHPLPWYNTLVWLAIVTPVPILALGAAGVLHAIRQRDSTAAALFLHWAPLMIARALPNAPPHDGIRLFLPAFGFWCVLAGVGAQRLWVSWSAASRPRGRLWRTAVVVSLAACAVNVARYHPQALSHYNLLVGGLRGAVALGFEPTYAWDSLDSDVLAWLNEHTAPHERVAFSSIANISMIRHWGWLKPQQADRRGVFKWYVFQNRTAFLTDTERYLMEHETPAYVKYPGRHAADAVPFDLAVPLLYVYSFEQRRVAIAWVEAGRRR